MPPVSPVQRVAFFGTPLIAIPALEWLLAHNYSVPAAVTQPDRPVGRKHLLTPSPVKKFAQTHGISVLEPEQISDEWIEDFAKYQPDVALLLAYGKILPTELLAIPRMGFLNIHASLLPVLRGPSPIQHAILKGMDTTGLTLQKISKRMDEGDVFGATLASVDPRETATTLEEKLTRQIPLLLDRFFASVLGGRIVASPQDPSKATYCKMIHDADGRIDWEKNAEELDRKIRAFNPNPGTFTYSGDQRIKVLEATVATHAEAPQSLQPGECRFGVSHIWVGTGSGVLEIQRLQPSGKRVLSHTEFIRGYPAFNGTSFR